MRIIAFLTDPFSIRPFLEHLGLPTRPPVVAPARPPPQVRLDFDQAPAFDSTEPEPIPDYHFDQSISG